MKNLITLFSAVLLTACVFAQTPQKMSYQAVVRDNSNQLVTNAEISAIFSILDDIEGNTLWQEYQTAVTNENGLFTVQLGSEETLHPSIFEISPLFIKSEIDPDGGSNYTITGISQLLSVPYAFYSQTAQTVAEYYEDDPTWSGTADIEGSIVRNGNVGIGVETPLAQFHTTGTVRFEGAGTPGSGKVLTSDDNGVATWEEGVPTYEIGDLAHGGIVFYVEPCGTRGLVAATEDQSDGIEWRAGGVSYATMARGNEVYAGRMNTSIIIAVHSAKDDLDDHAALVAANYEGGGFGDWYLPSIEELSLMYNNLHTQGLGGFFDVSYWSSSENSESDVRFVYFSSGMQSTNPKFASIAVRAVRAF